MKTPYDPALRVLQREMDDMRASIGVAADQLAQLERHRAAITASIGSEQMLASSDWSMPATAYFSRARAERKRLAHDAAAASTRLAALRDKAVESYGSLRAVETAADDYRENATRALANADQARIDDFASARIARQLRHARRPHLSSSAGDAA
ncbi:flagellar export protein FliJ [Sphingomonas sp. OV641]|uniref:hypothetical protein n=1 Tax=Sphingomonas sp. OV641 TaxID=1881068 RepID=UPI0008C59F22|nr:hypothetical protein [Sphingomonas sp. OV641]SEI77749.1 flagellar export protein FliJ [Sphingomonas sp. OV641]